MFIFYICHEQKLLYSKSSCLDFFKCILFFKSLYLFFNLNFWNSICSPDQFWLVMSISVQFCPVHSLSTFLPAQPFKTVFSVFFTMKILFYVDNIIQIFSIFMVNSIRPWIGNWILLKSEGGWKDNAKELIHPWVLVVWGYPWIMSFKRGRKGGLPKGD